MRTYIRRTDTWKRYICSIIGHDWMEFSNFKIKQKNTPKNEAKICERCGTYMYKLK